MTVDQIAALVIRMQDARNRVRMGLPLTEDLEELLDDAVEALCEAEEAVNFMELVESSSADDKREAAAFITSRERTA